LGAERRFDFKHPVTGDKLSINLEHGSLLLMDALSQRHWLHQLPKSKKVTDLRINLTFRELNDWTISSEDPQG
ncbi:MAG: alpha-ketoglutarate-dependent dioxygenase AlkB, partial [Gammaproteobacteria bacterium]